MRKRKLLTIVITLLAVGIVGALGGLGFVYSGIYDIAAASPHRASTHAILQKVSTRSVGQARERIVARDSWALTAFVVRMNTLTPASYQRMLEASTRCTPSVNRSRESGWSSS